MYDQNFKNQAVKECKNGQTISGTAKKYGISITALRDWIEQYDNTMNNMKGIKSSLVMPHDIVLDQKIKESDVKLNSVNISIGENNITISKEDVVKLMEIFYQFDK
tara:strand:- start:2668 stop:2985 length:318 start_codon:yes stop_codon:yes gene_type:complete